MGSFEVDPGFYDRFIHATERQHAQMRGLLRALESGEMDARSALSAIGRELHRLSGSAAMLELDAVVEAAGRLSDRLSERDRPLSPALFSSLEGWIGGLVVLAQRAARGERTSLIGQRLRDERLELEQALAEGPPSTAPPARPSEGPPEIRMRVLVLDDSDITRAMLCAALEDRGHPVAAAADLDEFEAQMQRFVPEVVLSDVNLGEARGDDLCRILKQRMTTLTPVVLISSMDEEELEALAGRVGADGYVSKKGGMKAVFRVLDDLGSTILF